MRKLRKKNLRATADGQSVVEEALSDETFEFVYCHVLFRLGRPRSRMLFRFQFAEWNTDAPLFPEQADTLFQELR